MHADWRVVTTDSAVIVIRGTVLYRADAGERLRADDIVESAPRGIVQLQDDVGNVLALGADTSVLLEQKAHVSLLSGWLKIAHGCAGQPYATPVIQTELGALEPADNAGGSLQGAGPVGTAAIVTAIPSEHGTNAAMFSESGMQTFTARGARGRARTGTQLTAGQFAYVAAGATIELQSRPSSAFLAGMPVPFRDALKCVPVAEVPQDKPSQPQRPVSYGDVSAWLVSDLPVRTRFAQRFRARLDDAAFRRDIDRNLSHLPDWRVMLYRPRLPRAPLPITPPPKASLPKAPLPTVSSAPPRPAVDAAADSSLTHP